MRRKLKRGRQLAAEERQQMSDGRQLEAEALAWAQSKRDEGHTVERVVAALYQAVLNIIPKDDPTKRLAILEGPRQHLIATMKREQDERDQSSNDG
jgi:hypothetical protein